MDAVDNILDQALRTYEESERSLKVVCQSVEQENCQLEDELKQLQNHQSSLIKQRHVVKEHLHQIRGEHARLAERQLIIEQQTQQIDQRYDQFQSILKMILSSTLYSKLNSSTVSSQSFNILGLKLTTLNDEHRTTNDVGTMYESEFVSSKRKLSTTNDQQRSSQQNHKHHRSHSSSSSQRSSK